MRITYKPLVQIFTALFIISLNVQSVAASPLRNDLPPATDTIGLVTSRNYQSDNLAQDDQYLYPTFNSLSVVDLNPESLKLFYKFRTDYIYDLVIKGQYAFAGQQTVGLRVFDITVATPTVFSSHVLPGGAYGLALSGDRLLVTSGEKGLLVLDTTKPYDMPQTGNLDLKGFAKQISIDGNRAVVAAGTGGAHLLDISDVDSPSLIATMDVCKDGVENAQILGSKVFLACGLQGLKIFDINNGKALKEQGSLETQGFLRSITLRDNLAYLAERDAGIRIVDISDTSNPHPLAVYNTPGGAWDIALKDNNIYVADYPYGLQVLRYNPPVSQDISADGGLLASESDNVQISFPVGVFERNVLFIHEPLPAINTPIGPDPTLVKVGPFFRNSATNGDELIEPKEKYTLSVAANTVGLTDRQRQFLSLYYWDPEIKRWRKDVSTRLDVANGELTATPSRLGLWGVFYNRDDVFTPIPVEEQ